jgi:hypothetical protein
LRDAAFLWTTPFDVAFSSARAAALNASRAALASPWVIASRAS